MESKAVALTLGFVLVVPLGVLAPTATADGPDKDCVIPADGNGQCTFFCQQGDFVFASGTGNRLDDIQIVAQCNGASAICEIHNEDSPVFKAANCPETRSTARVTGNGDGSCVLAEGLTASCRSWTPPAEDCVPGGADPQSYNVFQTPDARTFYLEERGTPVGAPIPGSGMLEEGTWLYEEANGLEGLQRGGVGLFGAGVPPPPAPPLLLGEDPVNDETCGLGPDFLIF